MTMWKIGDKVYSRFDADTELEIVSIEESMEQYYENGFSTEKIIPKYPVEWCKCKHPNGTIKEYMAIQLVQYTP